MVPDQQRHHPLIGRAARDSSGLASVIAWRSGRAITRARFLHDVMSVASALPDRACAMNVCDDRYLFMVGFAAAVVRGQVSLLPPSRVAGVVTAIMAEYPDAYLLVDGEVGDGALPQFRIAVDAGPASFDQGRAGATVAIPEIDLEQLVAVMFTSGSTGKAAPNPKTWGMLVHGAAGNAASLFLPSSNPMTVVATVPPQHMFGFEMTIMLQLLGHCSVQSGRPLYPEDVRRTLAAAPEPRMLVTTPVHLRALAGCSGDMPSVYAVVSSTAPLSPKLAAACEAKFAAPLLEGFGCTEVGLMATRRASLDEPWRLLDQFEIEANATQTLVRAAHLPAVVALQDVVEQLDQRHFRLVGRGADLVNIAGKRASLGDLNARLLSIAGVHDGIIFIPGPGTDDAAEGAVIRTAAFVVAPGMTREQVMWALRQLVDPAFLPRPLVLVDELPRSESSKLPHAAVLSLLATQPRT